LLLFGDRDEYSKPEQIVEVYKHLPNAQLAISPNSTHIDVSFFDRKNTKVMEQYILEFINGQ